MPSNQVTPRCGLPLGDPGPLCHAACATVGWPGVQRRCHLFSQPSSGPVQLAELAASPASPCSRQGSSGPSLATVFLGELGHAGAGQGLLPGPPCPPPPPESPPVTQLQLGLTYSSSKSWKLCPVAAGESRVRQERTLTRG